MHSAPDLFPSATSLPPRRAWLRTNDLIVCDYQHHDGGWTYDGLNTARFLCANRAMTRYASGDTQDAAEQAYCLRYDLPWWKLAEWNTAMALRRVNDSLRGGILATEPKVFAVEEEEMAFG